MVVAFEGWTDAGDAASGAVRRLIDACGLEPFDEIEPDEFVDFAMHRPVVRTLEDGTRALQWPSTIAYAPTRPSSREALAEDAGLDVSSGNEGELFALVGAVLLAVAVLSHRLILHPEAEFDGVTQEAVIGQVLLDTQPPSQRGPPDATSLS